ncbi:RICIN domain-containing protein, partial [Streptomyces sp. NPDC057575]
MPQAAAAATPSHAQQSKATVPVRDIRTFADKCLTVANRDPNNGARIVQYQCEGDFAQRFNLVPVGAGQYEIRTFANKCLTVANRDPDNGAGIVQYQCEGDFAQRF